MNCDRCPHMQAIMKALKPCQNCEAGKLHGEIHVDGYSADRAYQYQVINSHTSTESVTNLSPDDEDKLRRAMCNLFGLDPLDLLIVQHLFKGRPLAAFGDTMNELHKQIHHYRPNATRSMAHAKKNAICRVFPQIAPVFKHIIDKESKTKANPDDIRHLV